jgi:methyl-accepting chemotaxis protein
MSMSIKNLSLQTKIAVPILGVLALVVVGGAWIFISILNSNLERLYTEQCSSLAIASRSMLHSTAEEYVESKGMKFHRVVWGDKDAEMRASAEEGAAINWFRANPDKDIFNTQMILNDTAEIVSFAPARLQQECEGCHAAYGVDAFAGKPDGELVALFGVSGSLAEVQAMEARTREIAAIVGLGVFLIAGLTMRYLLMRVILRPMSELKMQAAALAEGDLGYKETKILIRKLETNDECAVLVRSFAGMVNRWREFIRKIQKTSTTVAEVSGSIRMTSDQVQNGSSEQSHQTGEVAAAMEEMSNTIMENSRNASRAAETAKRARDAASQGGIVVRQTIEGMQKIAEVVNRSSSTVQRLGKSSNQIGEIIGVIDDIADQTNLLALNAAIEAARAGEQGRGFAVVADEVRKLAERTTRATKEIADMIREIQTETRGAVEAMQEGTVQVTSGIELADKAGASLHEIVATAQEVADAITQIATASEEQSTTSEEISRNIEAISRVTSENSGSTVQLVSAAEDLNRLTAELHELINMFKLDEAAVVQTVSCAVGRKSTGKKKPAIKALEAVH